MYFDAEKIPSLIQIVEVIIKVAIQTQREEQAQKLIQSGTPISSHWFRGPHVTVLNAAPGLGKTVALVAAADYLWDTLPVLHLGPTHDSFENADRREGWGHWRGHDDGRKTGTPCDKFLVYRRGFNGSRPVKWCKSASSC